MNRNARRLLRRLADPEHNLSAEDFRRLQQEAVDDRNRILRRMRSLITPFGRAFSEALKEEGARYEVIVVRYLLRLLQDRNALLTLLQNVDFRSQEVRNQFDDLLSLLQQADVHTRLVDAENPEFNRIYREGMALAITNATAGMNTTTLLERTQAPQLDDGHQQGRFLLATWAASPEVTRRVIEASGRTNRWINRIAVTFTGGTALAIIAGGTITICYFAGVPMPLPLVNALALPGTTPVNLVTTAVQTVSQLGTGFVVQRINRGSCGCMCVRRSRGCWRPFITVTLYYLFVLILAVICKLFLPAPPDEWKKK